MNYDGNKIYFNMISGGLAGPASLISIYPTEYLKVQKQLKVNKNNNYTHICKQTLKNNGVSGFYKGLSNLLYFNIPKHVIQFTVFEQSTSKYKDFFKNDKLAYAFGGLTAGFCSGISFGIPGENLKVYKISQNSSLNFYQLNNEFVNKHGFKSYYNGTYNALLKDTVSQGSRFFLYASLMDYYLDIQEREKRPLDGALIGGIAGSLGSIINNPIDVVQTRMQSNYDKKYSNIRDCYGQIYKNEGLKGFYKGVAVRTSRTLPGMMIYFYMYELANKKLKEYYSKIYK